MREIHNWTGLRCDTYVNFLSMSMESTDIEESSTKRGVQQVSIVHADVSPQEKGESILLRVLPRYKSSRSYTRGQFFPESARLLFVDPSVVSSSILT
jgi:hypothetical protein